MCAHRCSCCKETPFLTQGLALEGVRRKLKEFHDSIGEEGGEEDAERQRAKVMRLLLELGYEEVAQPEEAPQPIADTNGIPDAGTGMLVMLCSTCRAYSVAQLLQVPREMVDFSIVSHCCHHKAHAGEEHCSTAFAAGLICLCHLQRRTHSSLRGSRSERRRCLKRSHRWPARQQRMMSSPGTASA